MPTGVYKHKKGRKITWGDKISKALKGKKKSPFSETHRRRMGDVKRGKPSGMLGKKQSEKSKKKISAKLKGIIRPRGKNSHAWKGGISFLPYSVDWTATLRRSIRERDHYTCQLCSGLQGDRAYPVHHIDYDKMNCNPDNLVTLCTGCHTETNYNRKYWYDYFIKLKKHKGIQFKLELDTKITKEVKK